MNLKVQIIEVNTETGEERPRAGTEAIVKGPGHWDYFRAVLELMQSLVQHEAIRASNKERALALQTIKEKV